MTRKNDLLAGGLENLLEKGERTAEKQEKPYIVVTYNLGREIVEKVEKVAYIDRKPKNAVITEALEMYFSKWKPQPEPKNKKL